MTDNADLKIMVEKRTLADLKKMSTKFIIGINDGRPRIEGIKP